MAYSEPATAVAGDAILASFWNTYGRDNIKANRVGVVLALYAVAK